MYLKNKHNIYVSILNRIKMKNISLKNLPRNVFRKTLVLDYREHMNACQILLNEFTNTNVNIFKELFVPKYIKMNHEIQKTTLFENHKLIEYKGSQKIYYLELEEMSKYEILYGFDDILNKNNRIMRETTIQAFTNIQDATGISYGYFHDEIKLYVDMKEYRD